MKPSELEALMTEKLGEPVDVRDMTDNGGFGLVRWATPNREDHVVHRWATVYTDGSPVVAEPPLLLYSGGYWVDEESARRDYRERNDVNLYEPVKENA